MFIVDLNAIKEHISDAGLKQTFIAKKAGMKGNQLCACLNGHRELKASEYANLCKALDVSFRHFLKESAEKVS